MIEGKVAGLEIKNRYFALDQRGGGSGQAGAEFADDIDEQVEFSAVDGSPLGGPARTALPARTVTVAGDQLTVT